jgi:long-chain acyl-CoA synthetase
MNKRWAAQYDQPMSEPLDYPEIPLQELLYLTAREHPDWVATSFNDIDMTYGQLDRRSNQFAWTLRELGVLPGDRIVLLLPNSPTYVIASYGVFKAGGVLVNANVMTRGPELSHILSHTGARIVVTLDIFLEGVLQGTAQSPVEHVIFHSVFGAERTLDLSAVRPRLAQMTDLLGRHPADPPPSVNAPDDLALLQLTSGTIGAPKAVMLTHRNLVANVQQIINSRPPPSQDNAAVICILPFFHVFGFIVCLQLSVLRGFRMVLVPRFDVTSVAALVPLLEKYRPVSFPAVPVLWAVLAAQGESMREILSCIEVPSSGGAPLPARVQEQFRRLTGHAIMEAYGLSEAPSTHTFPTSRPERPGSIGIPLFDTDARIVDAETGERELGVGEVGELVLKGPQIMRGYWKDEALTARTLRSGWLYTGDLARMDEDGYFYIVDRKDDLIITSGFNVYPSEVEAALVRHPAVQEAAVVGAADAVRGQVLVASVVLRDGATATAAELLTHCREHLVPHKVPRTIRFVAEIPKQPTGKAIRRLLRTDDR